MAILHFLWKHCQHILHQSTGSCRMCWRTHEVWLNVFIWYEYVIYVCICVHVTMWWNFRSLNKPWVTKLNIYLGYLRKMQRFFHILPRFLNATTCTWEITWCNSRTFEGGGNRVLPWGYEWNVIGNFDGREHEYADLFKYVVDSLQDSGFSALYKSGQQPVKLISG